MIYLEELPGGEGVNVAKVEKDCPVSVSELYIYTGVTEGIIDQEGVKHDMFLTKKRGEVQYYRLPSFFT